VDRRTAGGVLVAAAWLHAGASRALVHRLKYEGLLAVLDVAVPAMASLLPSSASALVPVPRATLRRWRHGIDPAHALAMSLHRTTGLPVVEALGRPLWYRHRAGAGDRRRGLPAYTVGAAVPEGAVLVDDVVTTGATFDVAAATIGDVHHAVTITAGPMALRASAAMR
jgi:predicted amidophosphoribosyltransferase